MRRPRHSLLLLCGLLAAGLSFAQDSKQEEQAKKLRQEGVALHDRGDYSGAIAKYGEALKLSPGNPETTYELSFSLYAKGDRVGAAKYAAEGAGRNSRFQPAFHMLLGNIRDDEGKLADAIHEYQEAIRGAPNLPLAHFNLGVACFRNGNFSDARGALEIEASLNPAHPGTQLMLGKAYQKDGYRAPALLAFSRFLFLEPATKRSEEARAHIEELYSGVAEVDAKTKNATISLDPNAKKSEGNFESVELMMGMAHVSAATGIGAEENPDLEPQIRRLSDTLAMIAEAASGEKTTGFAWEYYTPFLRGLYARQAVETYCRIAYISARLPKNDEWLKAHAKDIEDLRAWARGFPWPRPTVKVVE